MLNFFSSIKFNKFLSLNQFFFQKILLIIYVNVFSAFLSILSITNLGIVLVNPHFPWSIRDKGKYSDRWFSRQYYIYLRSFGKWALVLRQSLPIDSTWHFSLTLKHRQCLLAQFFFSQSDRRNGKWYIFSTNYSKLVASSCTQRFAGYTLFSLFLCATE